MEKVNTFKYKESICRLRLGFFDCTMGFLPIDIFPVGKEKVMSISLMLEDSLYIAEYIHHNRFTLSRIQKRINVLYDKLMAEKRS